MALRVRAAQANTRKGLDGPQPVSEPTLATSSLARHIRAPMLAQMLKAL